MRTKKLFAGGIAIICVLLMAVSTFAGCYSECKHLSFENGKCTECGYPCRHRTYENGVCTVCGTECAHYEYEDGYCKVCGLDCTLPCAHPDYEDGECVVCGEECTHEDYAEGECVVCGKQCAHHYAGNTCDICGMEKPSEEKPSEGETCTKHNYNEQWICVDCGHHKFPDSPEITDQSCGLPRINVVTEDGKFEDADREVPSYDNYNPDNNIDWQYKDCLVSVENCEEKYELSASGGIKVRGNWTTTYPKKPFRIKFDSKQSMLGLNNGAKMKSWVLLAEYKDFTLERNSVAFYLGNKIMGSDGYYSSDYQPVELYLNGGYRGVYLLAEQQQVNKNRINITEPEKDYKGTDIGYFIEYDGYYNLEIYNERFSCNYNVDNQTAGLYQWDASPLKKANGETVQPDQFGYSIKSDIYDVAQKQFIKNYVYNVYKLSYNAVYRDVYYQFNDDFTGLVEYTPQTDDPVKETISKAIDVQSLVDMYIHSEIVCDYDVNWSSFLMDVDFGPKAENNLLRFEAPWDFDSAFGLRDACASGEGIFAGNSNNPWLLLFVNEDWFQNMVKAKWAEMKQAGVQEGALKLITDLRESYSEAYERNFGRWGFIINGESTWWIQSNVYNHSTGVNHLYNWLVTRFNYLDSVWSQE